MNKRKQTMTFILVTILTTMTNAGAGGWRFSLIDCSSSRYRNSCNLTGKKHKFPLFWIISINLDIYYHNNHINTPVPVVRGAATFINMTYTQCCCCFLNIAIIVVIRRYEHIELASHSSKRKSFQAV